MSDGEYAIGACDDPLKAIVINGTLDREYTKHVLCHELTHAAMFSYNVNLSYEQEELVADLMATYGQEIIKITNALIE
jgi:Zn-dependent peptidase ImmA (M78 family)